MSNTELIGSSAKFRTVLHQVNTAASTNNSVLIPGETGTGKEMIAQAIYQAGTRRHYKFVPLNCAAIPAALQESDLFGHERGAFSGVVTQSLGRFQAADRIAKVAPPESTVLNSAEIGRGRDLTARAAHKRSCKSGRAPIKVSSAARPRSLTSSELFRYENEALTGAVQWRPRRFEPAGGGTTFRVEVGDLPPDMLVALMRVPKERELERVRASTANLRRRARDRRHQSRPEGRRSEGNFAPGFVLSAQRIISQPCSAPSRAERGGSIDFAQERSKDGEPSGSV
jgi:transcriptional regulator with GAF, ATPase, and Fis domain